MNRKYIKIIGVIILSLAIIYFIIFAIQNYTLKKSFAKETHTIFDEDTQLVRCNWNIFTPEFAFVYGDLGFYNSKNMFYQTKEEWNNNRVGGTTIQNTTFPQLLAMVKEDCYQFQTGSKEIKEKGIIWSYSEAESKEEKERRKKEKEERIRKEKEAWEKLSPEEKEKIMKEAEEEAKKIEEYRKLPDEEKLKILREKFGY